MKPFQPLRWLSNPHVQTIVGQYLHNLWSAVPSTQHILSLPDGDRIVLHETVTTPARPEQPVALLVHGLGGCARSGYMERITLRLSKLGWRAFRMDMRACGAGVGLARRFYTAACSQDVRAALEYLAQKFPQAPLAVLGFSLGGNIVLKYVGEAADALPRLLRAVVALAPPIDLVRSSEMLSRLPWYDAFYVYNLTRQVRRHQQHFPDLPPAVFPRSLTVRLFDDCYTAPRWGFAGALAYYREASAAPYIPAIRTPTFILTARDDPFVAVEPFEKLSASAVEVHISDQGGHLGFLGRDWKGGVRWAETQIIEWLKKHI
jgi:predicted alpha/beta-fold hydrolase